MRAFDAVLNGRVIDTVFYADSDPIEPSEVYRSLVNHDGYNSGIEVKEQRSLLKRVPKAVSAKDWKCQECGKLMTLKQAEKASFSDRGCLKCGGSDIDLAK